MALVRFDRIWCNPDWTSSASSAAILEQHFGSARWLVGNCVTYADFRVACVLPFADLAGLPLEDLPRLEVVIRGERDSACRDLWGWMPPNCGDREAMGESNSDPPTTPSFLTSSESPS